MPATRAIHSRRAALALALAALLPAVAPAQDATELPQRLIALRGEVESLNSELELLREEQRTTLLGLAQQKAELENNLKRQQLAQQEARDKVARLDAERVVVGAAGDALTPVMLSAIEALRAQVAAGLPFKTDERLAVLDEIRDGLTTGQLPPHRAANRLWAFHEDEFRVVRETGLHQQTIRLGDEQVLAQVAKVGAVMLLFKAPDGRLGAARRAASGWTWEESTDKADQQRIAALFDALDKQIRQGYFELPAALAASGN
ncbi:MAG: DUF3450 domain-containing protein [Xanthomonadaceae bacterium]|jgi:hypothetical protein|nr:DUF3450 domain-containing protein [Xanthomonadaceae bacterium]